MVSIFQRRRAGFALLIVTTLLAFMVVLLVGLALYTRVETAAAGNTQRQAQARENALLALNVALGQLQKHAGPDQRVTATADAFPNRANTRRYTGVWAAQAADDPDGDPLTPVTWLVSGNELRNADGTEQALAVTPEAAVNAANGVALVSTNTSRVANDVMARLVPITASGVPGTASNASTTVGRYAWWVGDQGVKAPVGVPDTSSTVTYAPYDSADLRQRIRQQIGLGAGATDANGNPVFEPRDQNNSALVANQKIAAFNQLAFLRNATGGNLALTTIQSGFHAWSPNNFAVLANTKLGGLRQDLSLQPNLLGTAFAAWADYAAYMEDPAGAVASAGEAATPARPGILPAYGTDPLRRRYVMQAPINDAGLQHGVAPVLTYFLLSWNVRTVNGSAGTAPLQARARWMISLWNPYTAALVPENLRLEITGLPAVQAIDSTSGAVLGTAALQNLYGDGAIPGAPLNVKLAWDAGAGDRSDHQSWLPGRVMTWASAEDTADDVPAGGFASAFDTRNLNAAAGSGVQRTIGGAADGNLAASIQGPATTLVARLYAARADGDVLLATFVSPRFDAFATSPQVLTDAGYQFSYVFRLAESLDTPAAPESWLLGSRRDPRRAVLRASAFIPGPNGPAPELYPNYTTIAEPERLLDRGGGSRDFKEDVPVFELPRSPLLSVGSLQHVARSQARAFGLGNSWGRFGNINGVPSTELFDRFFFSGVTPATSPTTAGPALVLPNPLLRTLRNPATAAVVTSDEFRAAADARSAKFLLQGGAFNVNSTQAQAWMAVLRGVRFPAPQGFRYLQLSTESGTADDASTGTEQSSDARFFRFAQSAQETYDAAADESLSQTANFRRGMRTLDAAQVKALAERIVALIRARHAEFGPFRSLEEFLAPLPDTVVAVDDDTVDEGGEPPPPDPAPTATTGAGLALYSTLGQSLLERAIAEAGINAAGLEFSSQFLTQADIMTPLAPVLFARSDTFVIRAYGEGVNPAKLNPNGTVPAEAVEGRAWCEAIVQRLPEYFDPSMPAETLPAAFDVTSDDAGPTPAQQLNKTFGRRFRVISFRWLTRSDI